MHKRIALVISTFLVMIDASDESHNYEIESK